METLYSILEGLLDTDFDVKDDDVLTFLQGGWKCSKCEMNGYWYSFMRGATKAYFQDQEKIREFDTIAHKMGSPIPYNVIKAKQPFHSRQTIVYESIAMYVVWFMKFAYPKEKSCVETVYDACSKTFRPKPGEIKISYKDTNRKGRKTITISCEYNGSVGSGNLGSHGIMTLQFYKNVD